ncbi:HAD family hydrolase [Actinotalea sp. K2]|uniref:HAD family hydrolase n=1 Tax=Actinotalea sp. K2 TaxID=2939438 RepID=UPI00201806F6|nr:HAD family hydrolase [Actinotalea sp. K2]MCL3860523.1 HAD family hydrolase [Actinotalea sp. K2]
MLFDIDDTLVDTRAAFGRALEAVAGRYLPDLGEDEHGQVLATWRADRDGHYARYTRGEIDYRSQRMARANALHAAFGGPVLDDTAYDAWDVLFEQGFSAAWSAHAEASQVVDDLTAAGFVVGALSNAAVAYQSSKLERVGLIDRVPMLVGVDTLGVGKPDPRVFREACRLLGTSPGRTAYVGDELDVDAVAAVRAGLVGIWVDRPGPRRVPVPQGAVTEARRAGVHVIGSLGELPALLGQVAQRPTA